MVIQASDIEQAIIQLTDTLRSLFNLPESHSSKHRNWWVLVYGDSLGKNSLAARDSAREQLRQQLQLCDIILQEYVWVWDDTNRVQILINQYANREEAEIQAEALRKKGLRVRVVREWDRADSYDKDPL